MNWVDFDEARERTDLVLMPFGAVEVYGPHLPMGADGISTSALAERIAEQEPAVIAPLIPVGYSRALFDFPGTLTVRPSSLVAYTRDIAESFIHWGFKRFLFINGHAGNVPYLTELATQLQDEHDIQVAQIDWWRFIQPLVADLVEADLLPHGHASEFGTSVLAHLAPGHVKLDRATRSEPLNRSAFPDFVRPRRYAEETDTGLVGDATFGSADKGAEVMRRAVARTLEFVRSSEFGAE
ncbi:MAG: creatininase family protein [Chloroflexota bacterium]